MGARRAPPNRDNGIAERLPVRLRETRANLGLTQEQLAERSGLSTGAINRIEAGTRLPSLETLECLALGLDTSLADLLAGAATARTLNLRTLRPNTARKVLLLLESAPEATQRIALELVRVLVRNRAGDAPRSEGAARGRPRRRA